VDTDVRDFEAPLTEPPAPPSGSRRHWVRGTVIALLVVLAVSAVAGGTWIARYQPLGADGNGFTSFPPSSDVKWTSQPVGWTGAPTGATIYSAVVPKGTTFTYGFVIANNGPVAVTIVAIGEPFENDQHMAVRRMPVAYRPNMQGARDTTSGWLPFKPFTLQPGTDAGIRMQATAGTCIPVASSLSFGVESITYRVFGFTRHLDWFQPNIQIDLLGQRGCQ